jgi:hypothetical protein
MSVFQWVAENLFGGRGRIRCAAGTGVACENCRAEDLIRINTNPQSTRQHRTQMKNSIPRLTAGALVLAAINTVYAQQYAAPASPAATPSPGLVNEWLRSNDPA